MSKKTLTELIDYITFHTTRIKQITRIHCFIRCPECQDIYLSCDVIGWTTTAHKASVEIPNATVWVDGGWYRLTEHDLEIKEEECMTCKKKGIFLVRTIATLPFGHWLKKRGIR